MYKVIKIINKKINKINNIISNFENKIKKSDSLSLEELELVQGLELGSYLNSNLWIISNSYGNLGWSIKLYFLGKDIALKLTSVVL